MFIILNKEKIYTYIISVVTVVMLFGIANILYTGENDEAQEVVSNEEKLLPIYNVETQEKKIAFTMNCAWSADDIDKILQALEKQQVKITFFMVGEWAEKNPEAVKKIYNAGHEIGTHSSTHPHVNNLSYEENQREIEDSVKTIKNITGGDIKLYRAPYGEYNNTVLQAVKDSGYYCIQWNRDTIDYEGLTGEQMWKRLENKLQNGDIILSHNGTAHTADSLEMLISKIKEKGFEIVKVSDLIYKENYTINNNGTQCQKDE